MRYQTVRELLQQIRHFHERVSVYYRRLGRNAGQERVRLLLDYLSGHERRLADAIGDFEELSSTAVQQTWLRNAPELSLTRLLQQLEHSPSLTTDDILRVGLLLDDHLQLACEAVMNQAETPEVRELFASLLETARHEKQNLVRQTTLAGDL